MHLLRERSLVTCQSAARIRATYLSAIPMSVSLPCPALIVSSAKGKSSGSTAPNAINAESNMWIRRKGYTGFSYSILGKITVPVQMVNAMHATNKRPLLPPLICGLSLIYPNWYGRSAPEWAAGDFVLRPNRARPQNTLAPSGVKQKIRGNFPAVGFA